MTPKHKKLIKLALVNAVVPWAFVLFIALLSAVAGAFFSPTLLLPGSVVLAIIAIVIAWMRSKKLLRDLAETEVKAVPLTITEKFTHTPGDNGSDTPNMYCAKGCVLDYAKVAAPTYLLEVGNTQYEVKNELWGQVEKGDTLHRIESVHEGIFLELRTD